MAGPPPPMPRPRPLGVTILAILTILSGIVALLLGVVILVLAPFAALYLSAFIGGLGIIAGLVLVLVGILILVAGFGLLRLRMWAWWLATIAFVLSLASAVVSANVLGAVIDVLLIIYLLAVRRHFG